MDLDLNGKSVVVTGGGSNIGRAIALAFGAEGACVTIGDIEVDQAERVAALARERGAGGAQVVKTDVREYDETQALIGAAVDKYGTLDILVNNVGWDVPMFFTQTTPDFWRKVIDLNYVGLLNCTKAALDVMIPKATGSIVALSSDASRQGEPREAVYGGIKAGVNSFMKTIAKENGRYGIRANAVCPGITIPEEDEAVGEHSMWAKKDEMFTDEQLEKIAKALPLKRIGRAGDIANAVLFLASNAAASYITGQILSVSGGYSMIG